MNINVHHLHTLTDTGFWSGIIAAVIRSSLFSYMSWTVAQCSKNCFMLCIKPAAQQLLNEPITTMEQKPMYWNNSNVFTFGVCGGRQSCPSPESYNPVLSVSGSVGWNHFNFSLQFNLSACCEIFLPLSVTSWKSSSLSRSFSSTHSSLLFLQFHQNQISSLPWPLTCGISWVDFVCVNVGEVITRDTIQLQRRSPKDWSVLDQNQRKYWKRWIVTWSLMFLDKLCKNTNIDYKHMRHLSTFKEYE